MRVTKTLTAGADYHGVVYLEGENSAAIRTAEIGGQKLFVDNYCFPCSAAPVTPPSTAQVFIPSALAAFVASASR